LAGRFLSKRSFIGKWLPFGLRRGSSSEDLA
jgi:hypothetical protein